MFQQTNSRRGNFLTRIVGGIFLILFFITTSVAVFADGNEQLATTLPVFKGTYDFGFVTLGAFGLRGEATALMKIPENAEIIAAYVYLSGYSNLTPDQLGDILVTVSNGEDTQTRPAKCIGYSLDGSKQSFTYRADATGLVTMGEKRYHVQSKEFPARPTSGGIYGGGLVAIYSLPNLPEAEIWIADGLDYFNAALGFPNTKSVSFQFQGNKYERTGYVKLFSGMDLTNAASAIWYKAGHADSPGSDIVDTPGAVDYNNSSNSDPNIDTDPLTRTYGNRSKWAMVEFSVPIQSELGQITFQLESQTDRPDKQPYSGVWNMIAFRLPSEETGSGTIGDRVFFDKDSSGTREFMEPGIPAVLVSLYQDNGDGVLNTQSDTFVDSVRTNRLGFYLFQYLKPGSYFVEIDHPRLSDPSIVLTGNPNPAGPFTIENGTVLLDVDFGIYVPGRQRQSPVQLGSFDFQTDSSGIWLNWSAFAGTENMGFDVFRSIFENGEFTRMTENIIPISNNNSGINNYSFFDADVEPGETYYYKLADVSIDGEVTMFGPITATAMGATDVADGKTIASTPGDFQLGEAYPNPFNGSATIQFAIATSGNVRLEIFNLMGQKIRTLVSDRKEAGSHSIAWDGKNDFGQHVGSGIYLYQMSVNDYNASKRIVYLK